MRVHGQTASAERHISNSCIHVNEIHLFFFFLSLRQKSSRCSLPFTCQLLICFQAAQRSNVRCSWLFPWTEPTISVSLDFCWREEARLWKHPKSSYSRSLILKSTVQSQGFSNLYISVKHKPVTVKHLWLFCEGCDFLSLIWTTL